MAQVFPSILDTNTPSSERKVFEQLALGLPHDWRVFHSRRLTIPSRGQTPARECELDFLVIDPARGVLGIEVKGGLVGRDEQGWFRVHDDRTCQRIKDPAAQVQHAMHELHRVIESSMKGRRISFGWAVCFPDATAPAALGADLPRALVLDSQDLEQPWSSVSRVMQAAVGEGAPLNDSLGVLLKLLAPRFQLTPTLAASLDTDERALVRLTEA